MPEATPKITKKSWRNKATERTKIINALNKRIKEIVESRDIHFVKWFWDKSKNYVPLNFKTYFTDGTSFVARNT